MKGRDGEQVPVLPPRGKPKEDRSMAHLSHKVVDYKERSEPDPSEIHRATSSCSGSERLRDLKRTVHQPAPRVPAAGNLPPPESDSPVTDSDDCEF